MPSMRLRRLWRCENQCRGAGVTRDITLTHSLWASIRKLTSHVPRLTSSAPCWNFSESKVAQRIYTEWWCTALVGSHHPRPFTFRSRSFLPLMYIGFPLFYGSWLGSIFSITQHAGLAEDVLDHRLNSRTVYMNFVFRFLYSEMNYHVEHHMFPLVPYHALGKLHQELKSDMPKPYDGLWEAYQEIIPTLLRQMKDPTYFVQRELPPRSPPQASSMAPSAYEQIVS